MKLTFAELHFGNFKDAEEHIKKSISFGDVKPIEYLTLSIILFHNQEYEESYKSVLNAYELMPNDIFIVEMKANNEFCLGKFNKCEETLKIIEQSFGKTAKTNILRYNIFLEDENYSKALRYLEDVIQVNPDYYKELYRIGNRLMFNRKYKEAIPFLEKAVEHEPNNSAYILRRGTAYYYTGKTKKARIDWDHSLKLGNKKAKEYINTYFD